MNRTKHRSQDEVKKMRRGAYIKIVATVGFIAAVLAYGTRSWFTMNKENNASGMGVKTATSGFELEVDNPSGATIGYSSLYGSGFMNFLHSVAAKTGIDTGDTICWRLSDEDKALQPGSEGVLHFTVTDAPADMSKLRCGLEINCYDAVVEMIPDPDNPTKQIENVISVTAMPQGNGSSTPINAANYLNHHVLYFTSRTQKTVGTGDSAKTVYQYSGFIPDPSSFELPLSTETNDGVTSVVGNIYWIWPRTFGQIILADGNANDASYSQGGIPILNTTGEANDRAAITAYLTSKAGRFFKQPQSETGTVNYADQLNSLYGVRTPEGDDPSPGDFSTQYSTLSNGYNNADQEIGKNVRYCLIVMTATG